MDAVAARFGAPASQVKLAAIQYRPPKGEPAIARRDLAGWLRAAGEAGAQLVVCPEMATSGYIWPDAEALLPHAEPAKGPTFSTLAPLAKRFGMWVVCGFPERDGERLYNAALVIGPDGALVGSYRKVLLFDADKTWASSGRERLVVETDFGPVMPGICMDINDPRFIESLHLNAPKVLAFCTNWVDKGEDPLNYWRMRLAFWRGWFVAANRWGEDEGVGFTGRSTILDPDGRVQARAPATGDALLLSD